MALSIRLLILIFITNYFLFASCKVFQAGNVLEFVNALDQIHAGDKIFLKPGIYRGDFVLPELGPTGKSHTLITSATQDAKSVTFAGPGIDPPLIINGTKWAITKVTISNKWESRIGTGLVVKTDDAFIKDVIFKDEDIAVQVEGNKVSVQNCQIHASQMGVYVQGNRSIVMKNRIYGANPCVFIDDVSCCGIVKENKCDQKGALFVNGQDYEMDEKTRKDASENKFVE